MVSPGRKDIYTAHAVYYTAKAMSTKNNTENNINVNTILKDIARRLEEILRLLTKVMEKYANAVAELPWPHIEVCEKNWPKIEWCKDRALYYVYIDILSDVMEYIDSAEFMLEGGIDNVSDAWQELDEAVDKLCILKTLLTINNQEIPEYIKEVEKELNDIRGTFFKLTKLSRGEEVELNYVSYTSLVKQLDRILSTSDALSEDLQKLKEQIKTLKEQLK